MKRTRTLFIASTIVLLAAGCGSDDNNSVASVVSSVTRNSSSTSSTESSSSSTDAISHSGTADLQSAVQATLDQGSADYTLQVAPSRAELDTTGTAAGGSGSSSGSTSTTTSRTGSSTSTSTGTSKSTSTSTGSSGSTTASGAVVDGSTQFDQDTRSVTVGSGGDRREAIVAGDSLYVQLDGGGTGSGSWGRIALADVRDASEEQIPLDLAVALHDPIAVLTAVGDAQTGTGIGTATSSTDSMSSSTTSMSSGSGSTGTGSMHQVVTVALSDIDDPFVALIADRTGAEDMQVEVWIDDSMGDPTISRIAYDLGSLGSRSTTGGTTSRSTTTAGGATSTTAKTGTSSTSTTMSSTSDRTGSGPFVVIDLISLGSAQAVEAPKTADAQDLQLDQLRTLLTVDLGLGRGSSQGGSTSSGGSSTGSTTTTTKGGSSGGSTTTTTRSSGSTTTSGG